MVNVYSFDIIQLKRQRSAVPTNIVTGDLQIKYMSVVQEC